MGRGISTEKVALCKILILRHFQLNWKPTARQLGNVRHVMRLQVEVKIQLPLKEVSVFRLAYESGAHHNGLEALAFDGPQSTIRGRLDGGCTFAVVQDGQLAEHLAWRHRAEVLVLPRYFHSTLCWRKEKKYNLRIGSRLARSFPGYQQSNFSAKGVLKMIQWYFQYYLSKQRIEAPNIFLIKISKSLH